MWERLTGRSFDAKEVPMPPDGPIPEWLSADSPTARRTAVPFVCPPVAGALPGPLLALCLSVRRPADVSDHDLIERIKAWDRMASWANAAQIADLMEFARRRPADPAHPEGTHGSLDVDEFASDEIACALVLAPLTAATRLNQAVDLCERLPMVLDAYEKGLIDHSRVNAFRSETENLSGQDAADVARDLLKTMTEQPLTAGQLRARLRRRVERRRSKAQTEEAEKREREHATASLGLDLHDLGNGTAELRALMSSRDAATAWAVLDTAARATAPGDKRTIGQKRIAALMALILGRRHPATPPDRTPRSPSPTPTGSTPTSSSPTGSGPSPAEPTGAGSTPPEHPTDSAGATAGPAASVKTIVDVTIPYSEFLKLADHLGLRLIHPQGDGPRHPGAPGRPATTDVSGSPATTDVSGSSMPGDVWDGSQPGRIETLGMVPGWVVRDLVTDVMTTPGTGFRAVVYDDETGELKGLSSIRYVPPRALGDHVRHRDVTCRFPGCRRSARRCDVDHCRPWQHGGVTEICNLQCLCRKHHRLKQNPAWRVRSDGSTTEWRAPTGHTYTTRPHDWRDPEPRAAQPPPPANHEPHRINHDPGTSDPPGKDS
jgi:Domain of unknown function (DUF222)